MKKIGFMFGAGAEISYGMSTSGDFALNIFRQAPSESKKLFKSQRTAIEVNSSYAEWLPSDYMKRSIPVFKNKAFEDIIHSTLEQNREMIIQTIQDLDSMAKKLTSDKRQIKFDIHAAFKAINSRTISGSSINNIKFVDEFQAGDGLFKSKYFSALLIAYKKLKNENKKEAVELGQIIFSIFQLQIGALGEKLIHKLNEGVFAEKDDDFDFLNDFTDFIQLNYQSLGLSGLEYLLNIQEPDSSQPEGQILRFAQLLLEKIYASILDYKSLIDSNWMYLYYPSTDWSKFCKISIFLHNVQKYIHSKYIERPSGNDGYYNDINQAIQDKRFEICGAATSNYSPLISDILKNVNITYLHGSTTLWYDPYLNQIGTEDELLKLKHFIVPLIFTQSGTKPMVSIDMSRKYVEYYQALENADNICVIGYNFNRDDEHINGIFRTLIERNDKTITLVTLDVGENEDEVSERFAQKLKLQDNSHISVILVDNDRKQGDTSWLDRLLA